MWVALAIPQAVTKEGGLRSECRDNESAWAVDKAVGMEHYS